LTRIALSVAALACTLHAAPVLAQGAHELRASFDVHSGSVVLDGRVVGADVYRPASGASIGVAILAHGFSRERSRHRDLGRALAEAGVTAVVPDLPNVIDHWANGEAIVALVLSLERGSLGLAPVERAHLVLAGTSAGGFASLLAAERLPGLAGWVGLDPVDRTGGGVRAASKLESPALVLLAEPSACNLFGSGRSIARAAPRLLRVERIRGASHCDFESPTTKLCRAVCGESTADSRALARGHTVAAVLELLGAAHDRDAARDDADEH
jgi:pimeloyl-ACP methyl ester carboxylesterase